jgi:hypothetical protein
MDGYNKHVVVEVLKEFDGFKEKFKEMSDVIDYSIKSLTMLVWDRDKYIERNEKDLAEKVVTIAKKDVVIAEKDKNIVEKDEILADKDEIIAEYQKITGRVFKVNTSCEGEYKYKFLVEETKVKDSAGYLVKSIRPIKLE